MRSHPFALDVALVTILCAVTLITSVADARAHGVSVRGAVVLAGVTAYGAVLLRRRWPLAALSATVTAATAFMTLTATHGLVVLAPMIALYHLAASTGDRRRMLAAGGLAAVVMAGVPELIGHASGWDSSWLNGAKIAIAAGCGLALAAGDATRSRRAYLAEVERRARRAELGREQEARRRVTEERLRIARDLHDSMGHHLALINAQAGMAGHVFDEQPAAARQALTHIRRASRAALDDLRDTVSLLRQPDEPAAPTEPAAGVSGIGGLVASLRGSGMPIAHEVDGSVRPLPPAADRTAYRVVQEALTNVAKHAAGAPARVWLHYQLTALHVVVENDGNGQPDRADATSRPGRDGAGHGIEGMRERVLAAGGSLDAGARPGGGFRVSAVLPLPEEDRT